MKIRKDILYILMMTVLILISFRTLILSSFTAIMGVLELVLLGVIFLWIVYKWTMRIVSRDFTFDFFTIFVFLLGLLPITASIGAKQTFDQPILFGVSSFKDYYLALTALIIYDMLKNKVVTIGMVEKAFLIATWAGLIYFYAMSLFTNPSAHVDSLLAGSQLSKGGDAYYRFNMALVFFGMIYYFAKAYDKQKFQYLLLSLLFFAYIVLFRVDRTSMVAALVGAVGYFVFCVKPKVQFLSIVSFTGVIVLMLTVASLIRSDAVAKYDEMFSDAIDTVLGESQETGQAAIRAEEFDIAWEYAKKSPYIGNGKVSHAWKEGGYDHFLGFFYPSDVGFVGQIFIYGFFGAFLLYSQFLFSSFMGFNGLLKHGGLFVKVCVFFMITLGLDSLTNGYVTVYAAQSVVVLGVLYAAYRSIEPVRSLNLQYISNDKVNA